ncbi:hypothetical protein SLEP1_g31746 [Rubroshorea leprosula]|uniref:Uncharacterized protein n=1 Tax=Rubroshorea leprosula TaxID=152421 RepID=A0AAV5K9Q4_9ROSI|nr:hypothetical protein SLEP1_g31746 [Rubroshorea leprosula]
MDWKMIYCIIPEFAECQHDTSKVTEELVENILCTGLEPVAVDVFLEFICYPGGSLPEELLLPQFLRLSALFLIACGDKDPSEPMEILILLNTSLSS